MGAPRTRSTGPEVDQQVGDRIREYRTERGWNWLQLHDEIMDATRQDPWGPTEISPATLKNMEDGMIITKGKRQVRRKSAGEIRALALAFGVSTDDLIFGRSRLIEVR